MISDSNILVYICRHGRTILNAEGRFRGNRDVPLDSTGTADAHKLASMFENIDLAAICCSDRVRATKTAQIIADKKDMKIHPTEQLRALNIGEFSGLIRDKANTEALESYISDPLCCIPGGESLQDFQQRIRPCIDEAVDIAEDAGKPVMVVAHSSIVHEISSYLVGDHTQGLVEPGGVVALYVDNGQLKSSPIFKPVGKVSKSRADTIS